MSLISHALKLASAGFWLFPCEGLGKKPAFKGWQAMATRDPAKLREWFTREAYNIGIFTGKFKENSALIVIDVDNKSGKKGDTELLRLEFEFAAGGLPDTFEVQTPTGGRHIFFEVNAPVKQGADLLAPGLDIRSKGGLVVGAGSITPAGEYKIILDAPVAPAPQWLIDMCGRDDPRSKVVQAPPEAIDKDQAYGRGIEYVSGSAPVAIEGQRGDETTYKVAARLRDFGCPIDDAYELMSMFWNPKCVPPWSEEDLHAKIVNAYKYGQNTPGVDSPEADFTPIDPGDDAEEKTDHPIYRLNNEYAFVIAGSDGNILWETTDSSGNSIVRYIGLNTFHQKFAPEKIMIGKKQSTVSKEWIEWKGRRSFDGVCMVPERPGPARFYNLWRGFSVTEPLDSEQFPMEAHQALQMYLDHIYENVCQGEKHAYEWLMSFFAHVVQKPWEKPLVSVVLRGGRGVGKNILADCVGHLLGQHYLLTSNRRYLTGNFNGHLENLLMFVLDEAFWSGDKQAEGTLKDLITGKKHLIERKGCESYTVDNLTRIIIIGNEDWLVPAAADDRRFAVYDVGDRRQQDTVFFSALRRGMELGGYRLLFKHLREMDISKANLNTPPVTKALLDQKTATLDPFDSWWFESLWDGKLLELDFSEDGWPARTECRRFQDAYLRYLKLKNIRSRGLSAVQIGIRLKKICRGLERKKVRIATGGFSWEYQIPPLADARSDWDHHIRQAVKWPT